MKDGTSLVKLGEVLQDIDSYKTDQGLIYKLEKSPSAEESVIVIITA